VPDMTPVSSSMIESVGYDADNRELHVQFVSTGEIYVYYNVEEWVYTEMISAGSVGSYFHANIKDAYEFGKL